MKLISSDPEIESLVKRILRGDLDLQPNFQRGEVWSTLKKQRLVDSILRDWYIPPIHIIQNPNSGKLEVLDGQQRLTAIRDFLTNQLAINGNIAPFDERIRALDGLRFRDLSDDLQARINLFPIRTFRLVDYDPSEPAELFFRLNQPASLTSAEQRNAFFGPVRGQVKHLVGLLASDGMTANTLGFSNVRMAYDDVIARIALAIERDNLAQKITSLDLENLYRREEALGSYVFDLTRVSLAKVSQMNGSLFEPIRFNKASLFTWALFAARAQMQGPDLLSIDDFISFGNAFQDWREMENSPRAHPDRLISWALYTYRSRTSFRVGDISSVVLRDASLWVLFAQLRFQSLERRPDTASRLVQLVNLLDDVTKQRYLHDEMAFKELLGIEWQRLSK